MSIPVAIVILMVVFLCIAYDFILPGFRYGKRRHGKK